MKFALLILVPAAIAAPAWAAEPGTAAPAAQAQERIHRMLVFGNDPCPRDPNGDIVICGRRPERDRYRVPKALRDEVDDDPNNIAWASKRRAMEYVGRTGTQSCSAAGPGGSTGCWQQLINAARSERHPQ